jgi:PAS domain S-box-containing protein
MNLRKKILSGYLTITLLIIAIGVIVSYNFSSLGQRVQHLTSDVADDVAMADKIATDVLSLRIAVEKFIALNRNTDLEKAENQIERLNALLAEAKKTVKMPERAEKLGRIQEKVLEYIGKFKKVTIRMQAQKENKQSLYATGQKIEDELSALVATAMDESGKSAEAANRANAGVSGLKSFVSAKADITRFLQDYDAAYSKKAIEKLDAAIRDLSPSKVFENVISKIGEYSDDFNGLASISLKMSAEVEKTLYPLAPEIVQLSAEVMNSGWQEMRQTSVVVDNTRQQMLRGSYAVYVVAILLAIAIGLIVERIITVPLSRLVAITRKIALGDYDQSIAVASRDEIGDLTENFNNMIKEVAESHASLGRRVEELRFRNILLSTQQEASIDGILAVDESSRIVSYNKQFISMWGIPAELVESGSDDLARQYMIDNITEPSRFLEKIKYLYEHRGENSRDEIILRDGRIFDCYTSPMFGADGVYYGRLWLFRDITEHKHAEQEIRQSRDYLEYLFKASPDAIIVTDTEGYIRLANESVYGIYGYHPGEIIGQHAAILTPENETALQKSVELLAELFEKGFVNSFPTERINKNGEWIQIESSAVLLKNPDGTASGVISASRNITNKKRLEEQLRQSQKMEAIGTLAGGIAHDFNNMLAAIIGYTELSLDLAAGNSKLERNLAQVLQASDRAKNLVKQILTFSRKNEHDLKPIQTHLIIQEALKLLRSSIPSTIDIRYNITDRDDIVIADSTHIHQIVMNLCTNAAHAMQQARGLLEITLQPVDIDEQGVRAYVGIALGPYLQLSVKDTGTGIPGDIIGRIFEPFFTTKEVDKGTGMGLSVVHGIVKSLKGDIKVYSEPGRGTVFHVLLPRVQDAPPDRHAVVQTTPHGHESVLLMDDEALLLDVGVQMLGSLGYRVTALRSPLEALELFKKNPAAFDVVITDQTMPQLTGYELAQQLMQVRPDIPIILCTGYSDLVTEESALSLGIKAFLIKPLNRLILAETIRRVLDKKNMA